MGDWQFHIESGSAVYTWSFQKAQYISAGPLKPRVCGRTHYSTGLTRSGGWGTCDLSQLELWFTDFGPHCDSWSALTGLLSRPHWRGPDAQELLLSLDLAYDSESYACGAAMDFKAFDLLWLPSVKKFASPIFATWTFSDIHEGIQRPNLHLVSSRNWVQSPSTILWKRQKTVVDLHPPGIWMNLISRLVIYPYIYIILYPNYNIPSGNLT